ncbi:MAG: methyltransferase domain-containing protein [Treponema sp.]|nr:methyltransferase domain-containing protein [Treponema sp.]
MAEFISSFITGFQEIVNKDLPQRLPGVKILNIFDGLVHYQYAGDSHNLEKIIYFNNTFFVLKTMKGKGLNFPSLVGAVASEKKYYLINKGTFRVRFQNENQFAKVDKNISKKAEETVLRNSKLQLDRLSPTTEIWYSIRREGFAFCGQLVSKREFTEKNLNKGELRPEIAYFICCYSDIKPEDVIAEPFCGYGSIPVQLMKKFHFSKLIASDLDSEKIELDLQKKQLRENPQLDLSVNNAFELPQIKDNSIDVVITDPPWGYYEDIGDVVEFYKKMFTSFKRILKTDGRMIILSARKEEIQKAASEMNVQILSSLNTLVNGKKASLYKMIF